ncbi:protein of unknown function [Citrobacter amalonaticus]|uniref:Uncharacterized protein n=1 Tax=Citrobacter amalonaticus TaxID=35703 RepID=A0AAX2BD12_CITAM|nr:protein of unknown function [Citrobacter amalonaticus]
MRCVTNSKEAKTERRQIVNLLSFNSILIKGTDYVDTTRTLQIVNYFITCSGGRWFIRDFSPRVCQ